MASVLRRNLASITVLAIVGCGSPTAPTPNRTSSPPAGGPAASSGTSAPGSTIAAIESVSVVEFQYPSAPGRWFYAPLVRVAARGDSAVIVTSVAVTIPGLGPAPPVCGALRIEAGASVDLFRELYGDYALTIDQGGVRSSGGAARVTISLEDEADRSSSVAAEGPIVSGSLPTTYTGGSGTWLPCR